jgi:hypothetical protein
LAADSTSVPVPALTRAPLLLPSPIAALCAAVWPDATLSVALPARLMAWL